MASNEVALDDDNSSVNGIAFKPRKEPPYSGTAANPIVANGSSAKEKLSQTDPPPPYEEKSSDSSAKKKKKKKKKKSKEGDEEGDDDEDETKEPEVEPIPFMQLFKYATSKEVSLMILGITAATIAGICLPLMVILFGRLTNAFVYQGFNYTEFIIENPQYENTSSSELADILGITSDFHKSIRVFGIGVSVIGVIEFLMGYIFVTTLNYAAESQMYRLRRLFLKSILKQEIGWFDTHQTNDFASRATEDMNKMQEGMGEKIGLFIFFTSNFLFSLVNAFYHGWQLTLVILSVFPLLGVSMGLLAKIQTSLVALELKEYARAGSIAEEVISSIRTVVSYGGEEKEVERYEKNLVYAKTAGIKRGLSTGVGMGMAWFFIYCSYSLGFWYGTKLILDSRNGNGNYDPSDLIIVFFSVLMGAMNMGQSSPYIEAFHTARGAASTIYGVIERPSEIDPTDEDGDRPIDLEGNIEFRNVYFNYPSRPTVNILQGLSLRIEPGHTVALVGSSGCGKSTCVQLIQRFYDAQSGSIFIDGTDIKDFNIGWLRDHIGIVGQEPVLFGTTIEENIRYGKENATFEEVQQAAIEANAHDFIMRLPKQYDTQVGDRGTQISGGQKQRIAIARALIKRPKILLLDEATSALDNQSEAIVQRALDKARKGRTTIIVAHRLTTIRTADLIIVMEQGRISEHGTHKELMAKNGVYRSLVNAQLNPQDLKKASLKVTESSSEDESEGEILQDVIDDIVDDFTRVPSIRQSNKNLRKRKSSAKKRKSYEMEPVTVKDNEAKPMSAVEILRMNSPEWYYILVGVIASAVQGCIMPAFAILFGNVIGVLALADPAEAQDKANKYCILFLVIGVVAAVAMFLQSYMFGLSGEILTMRIRKRAFGTMLRQEMGWFDEEDNSVGALCSRLSGDAAAVQGATGSRIGTIIQAVVTLVVGIGLAMYYNAKLGAVTLPFLPLIIISIYIQSKMIMGQSLTESKILEEAGKIAVEAIGNIRTVTSLHKEEVFITRYAFSLHAPHVEALKKSHVRGLAFGFANSMMFFAYAAVMFYGGVLVEKNQIEFEEVFKVAEALILGTAMVGQAVAFAPNYGKAKVASARLASLFDRRPQIDTSAGVGLRMTAEVTSIELKDVFFSYPTRSSLPILQGMSVTVTKGESVALVGSSGCGKSTIINLLERFYNLNGGEVILNDKNIEALNVGYVRSLFGLVSQEPVLFDRTIAENIAYGDNTRSFSYDDIQLAAKQANIHTFIDQLPLGYSTRVGSKGTQLSGGQKQRIAIARALIRNPQVLLLDEATSALDAESEKIVQATLEDVQKGRTSIIIAHRLSTIRGADKIVVLQGGKVVEFGTHSQLINMNGVYSNLYQTNA